MSFDASSSGARNTRALTVRSGRVKARQHGTKKEKTTFSKSIYTTRVADKTEARMYTEKGLAEVSFRSENV